MFAPIRIPSKVSHTPHAYLHLFLFDVSTRSESDWDIMWYDREYVRDTLDDVHLEPHQRVNHFRNHYELTRKDLLIKNLKRKKKDLAREGNAEESARYDFFPQTYQLPGEYAIFVESFKRSSAPMWIMKPIAKSQGKGIFLFTKLSQISEWKSVGSSYNAGGSADPKAPAAPQAEQYVVQEYVSNPLLIGGKKVRICDQACGWATLRTNACACLLVLVLIVRLRV
jgi:tubulin polyglutamylase TTLL9